MPINRIHPITLEGDHEKRIRELERQVKRLATQNQSVVSVYTDAELADLAPNAGAVWVGSGDQSFNYHLNGVTYQVFGS